MRTAKSRPAGPAGRPPRSAAHDAVVAVLRAADVVRRQTAAIVEPAGITVQQFNVLRILRGAEAAGRGGLPTLEVGSRMIEQTPGVTRLLDRLEAKRLVSRERCAADRRQHLCRITPLGLDVLAGLDQAIFHSSRQVLIGITSRQQGALAGLLGAVMAAHDRGSRPGGTSAGQPDTTVTKRT